MALPILDFLGNACEQAYAFAGRHVGVELGFDGDADLVHGPSRVFFPRAVAFLARGRENSPCSG